MAPLDWIGDMDRIRKARSNMRNVLSRNQVKNPALFIAADHPLEAQAPPQQRRARSRLSDIASAEGSSMSTDAWKDEIDPTTSLEANVRHFRQIGGKLPEGEREGREARRAEAARKQARSSNMERAVDTIKEWCREFDDEGIDGADVMALLLQGATGEPLERAREAGFDLDTIDESLESMTVAFDRGFVVDTIDECRAELAPPEPETTFTEDEIVDRMIRSFDLPAYLADDLEDAIDLVENQFDAARADEREQIVNRLSRNFGISFDSVDDAIDRIKERTARGAPGPTIESAEIQIRRAPGGELRTNFEGDRAVKEYRDNVRRRINRALDIESIQSSVWKTIGTIRLENGDLAAIDLEPGIEQYGVEEDVELEPIEVPEDEGPPEPESEGDQLAASLIDELGGDV